MPTLQSYFLNSAPLDNIGWVDRMEPTSQAAVNLFGTMLRFRNSDGTFTVLHGDLGGFHLDGNGVLQGTIRWITLTTAPTGSGFETMAEFAALGDTFNHLNIDLHSFLSTSGLGRWGLMFNRGGLVVNGDAGNNRMGGGIFGDKFHGGAGSDTVSYQTSLGGVTASLVAGPVRFGDAVGDVYDSIENLTGTRFNDALHGNGGVNRLSGLDGDDTLFGGAGNDALFGGDGNDDINPGGGNDQVEGGDGTDTLDLAFMQIGILASLNASGDGVVGFTAIQPQFSFSGFENLSGGTQGDELRGNGGANVLRGAGGRDLLFGGAGKDTLYGGGGVNTLSGGLGADVLWGEGAGSFATFDDPLISSLTLNLFDDNASPGTALTSDGATDLLWQIRNVIGSRGNDMMSGNGSANVLRGEGGDDLIYGRAGDDSIDGGDGKDEIYGDNYWGFQGGNEDWGDDTLQGGAGNDRLMGGNGSDQMLGGAGLDRVDYSGLFDDFGNGEYYIDADLAAGSVKKWFYSYIDSEAFLQGTDTVDLSAGLGVEAIAGTFGNDILRGSSVAETLVGLAGNDRIEGRGGNDLLDGGLGADTMLGGTGNDTYYTNMTQDVIDETGGGGIDTVRSWRGTYALGSGLENMNMAGYAVTGTGNGLDNVIVGTAQANTISGNSGNDRLTGGAGNDVLSGGNGNDTIFGEDGVDRITGGAGRDWLQGGSGADTFVFGAVADSMPGAAQADLIRDLEAADRINLSAIDANGAAPGNAFTLMIDPSDDFTGVAGQLRYTYSGGTYTVQGDVNGDAVADIEFRVELMAFAPFMSASNFIL